MAPGYSWTNGLVGTPSSGDEASYTHSWFSIRCISSLMLMAVVSSSSSSSGFLEASLSERDVSSSLTSFRSRFRPTVAGTLMGDKCRDYRTRLGWKSEMGGWKEMVGKQMAWEGEEEERERTRERGAYYDQVKDGMMAKMRFEKPVLVN